MSDANDIVFLCILIFLSVVVLIANTFTVFVFWIHRNKLKRTFFLVINLTVADLLAGLTAILLAGTLVALPRHTSKTSHYGYKIFVASFHAVSSASVFFLALISLERAFALIWPLRHRVTSTKVYIYSVVIVWLAGIAMGVLGLLTTYQMFELVYDAVVFPVAINVCLVTICVSYLSIRKKVFNRNPANDSANNRQNVEQNTRLSKTFFIVIGASIAFWAPSVTLYSVGELCPGLFPEFVNYILTMLHLSNSLVNPIIYSLRMPVFRETFRQLKNKLKMSKRSKRYTVRDGNLRNIYMHDARHLKKGAASIGQT